MKSTRKIAWKTTAIPVDLYKQIEQEYKRHGYTSILEFVKDSVRRRLEQLRGVSSS